MKNIISGFASAFSVCFLLFNNLAFAQAQDAAEDLAANQKFTRQWLEAFYQKDLEKVMSFYWNSPELVVIIPDGTVYRGWDAVRQDYEKLFSGMEAIRGEVVEVTHMRSGDGVLTVGTITEYFTPKSGPPYTLNFHWSDFRRNYGGHWVVVYEHMHALPPPGPPME